MTTLLVWLRRDLRLADNPALTAALAEADRIVPVYIHAPEEDGEWPPGSASRWWLHHSLAALAETLARRGAPLVLRPGPSLAALRALIGETGAAGVYFNRLYEPDAAARDARICAALETEGVIARGHAGALLAEPWAVGKPDGGAYRVFTPFWRRLRAGLAPGAPLPPPPAIPGLQPSPGGPSIDELEVLPRGRWTAKLAAAWQPGEAAAQARLEGFAGRGVTAYPVERDYPACDGSSRLSPRLHFGELSPRQVWEATAAAGEEAEPFLRQLGWREFAHHVLWHWPATPERPLDSRFEDFPWRPDPEPLVEAWRAGCTGYPLVDAGMRQLWATGWLHNRVRMTVASLLVKNLRVPWQEGARWFWDTLVDADLANNTLGWQWAGGCGADAAPYFRILSPARQGERFDPDGAYVRYWVPELAAVPDRWLHRPGAMPEREQQRCGVRIGRDYPGPVVDQRESRAEALAAFRRLGSVNRP